MNEFSNTNYSHNISRKPVGVYYIRTEKRCKKKILWLNFYFVRVSGRVGVTTIAKCEKRADAERVFRERMPDWTGEIPYYEIGNKRPTRK